MKIVYVNTGDYKDPEILQEYLKQELEFPEYYGGNLSALNDCLTELSCPVTICFCGNQYASDEMEKYIKKVLTVCLNAAMENDQIHLLSQEEEIEFNERIF